MTDLDRGHGLNFIFSLVYLQLKDLLVLSDGNEIVNVIFVSLPLALHTFSLVNRNKYEKIFCKNSLPPNDPKIKGSHLEQLL